MYNICSNMNLLVQNLHVLNRLPCSDHLLIVVIFNIAINVSVPTNTSAGNVVTSSNWSKATDDDISLYIRATDVELRSFNVPNGLLCRVMHCKNAHYVESIDLFYSDICNALIYSDSSAQCIGVCKTGSAKDFKIPGFNDHVKTLPTEACHSYIIWRNMGKLEEILASECVRLVLYLNMHFANAGSFKSLCVPMPLHR